MSFLQAPGDRGSGRGLDNRPADVVVVGGGLAGTEAAWQVAERGLRVRLFEMRPRVKTNAHRTDRLAELVCSNSLKSVQPHSGPGILKAELRRFGSIILEAAETARIEAGTALTVDREIFAAEVTRRVSGHPRIEIVREELTEIPEGAPVIIATGPLSSPAISEAMRRLFGAETLYFYDAIAPIVSRDSLDMGRLFAASRYDKGEASFLNAPMNAEEYGAFHDALTSAEVFPLRKFERGQFFQGCLPIEDLAYRGRDTLAFGCMRPVGLIDPRTGRRPHAVVQLRPENRDATCYSLVGCQSRLKIAEQRRIFRMIPGLQNVEFFRFGSLHRNTYLCSPAILRPTMQTRVRPELFLAGQITGVEGYLESTAMGLLAAISCVSLLAEGDGKSPPRESALGSLVAYLMETKPSRFQPMNINMGLFPDLPKRRRSRSERDEMIALRAERALEAWASSLSPSLGAAGEPA